MYVTMYKVASTKEIYFTVVELRNSSFRRNAVPFKHKCLITDLGLGV